MGKKNVVWGTGGGAVTISGVIKNIDFYIENDKSKCGIKFLGKEVFWAQEFKDWNDIFVYIYPRHYDEISKQLQEKGLVPKKDFIKFDINCYEYRIDIEKEIRDAKKELADVKEELYGGVFFFASPLFVRQRELYIQWFNQLYEKLYSDKVVVFSKYMDAAIKEVGKEMKCSMIGLPRYLYLTYYSREKEAVEINTLIKEFFIEKKELEIIAKSIRSCFVDMQEGYEYVYVYHTYYFFENLLVEYKPNSVIMWGAQSQTHNILRNICLEKGIDIFANHEGPLYGTWWFDPCGEHGESLPVIYGEKFRKLPLDAKTIQKTKEVLNNAKQNKINRRLQPLIEDFEELKKINNNRPIVTFLGDDDYGMSLVPPSERVKKSFSPIFNSGIEEAIFLYKLAQKNQWNFIYKPHPGVHSYRKEMIPENCRENMIFIENMDINKVIGMSDVVIINISSCGYLALIEGKPVVATGRTTYYGAGCTYEVECHESLEKTIKSALIKGYTGDMQRAFVQHIALLLKYYLYNGNFGEEYQYGREIPNSVKGFNSVKEILDKK